MEGQVLKDHTRQFSRNRNHLSVNDSSTYLINGEMKNSTTLLSCFDLCRHRHSGREGNIFVLDPDGETLRFQLNFVNQIACYTYKLLRATIFRNRRLRVERKGNESVGKVLF